MGVVHPSQYRGKGIVVAVALNAVLWAGVFLLARACTHAASGLAP